MINHRISILFLLVSLVTIVISTTLLVTGQGEIPLPVPDTHTASMVTELLINPGFELDADGDKIPDGWQGKNLQANKADNLKCNKANKTFAHSGNCAFMFRGNPDGSSSKLQQKITATDALVSGAEVTFSAYVDARKVSPGTGIAKAIIKYTDSTRQKLGLVVPAGEGYLHAVADEMVGNSGVNKVKVQFSYGQTSGKLFLDEVRLTVRSVEPTSTVISTTSVVETVTVTPSATVTLTTESPTVTATETASSTNTQTPTSTVTLTETPTATETATNTATNTPTTPLTPNPYQLVMVDSSPHSYFGSSLSISDDEQTVLVGANMHDNARGAVYVFTRVGENWITEAKLSANDAETSDYFGYSARLSSDGNIAVIGSHQDDIGSNPNQGSVYIYRRTNGVWTQQAKLTPNDGQRFTSFGASVNISKDGNIIVVGAIGDVYHPGAIYVFTQDAGTWRQTAKLVAGDGYVVTFFGYNVSISDDASTILVGVPRYTVGDNSGQGTAYVFTKNNGIWRQTAKLTADDGEERDSFGSSVSLSSNGNIAVIGASRKKIGANRDQGAIYVFTRDAGNWRQSAKLTSSNGRSEDSFGESISLNGSGDTIIVGSVYHDFGSSTSQGTAYVFKYNGGMWSGQIQLVAPDGMKDDRFGLPVLLSKDGHTALVSAQLDTVGGNVLQGSAWVFSLP